MKKIIDEIVVNVAELPDRNSPDDWPDAMLVTGDELSEIIEDALENHAIVPKETTHEMKIAGMQAWDNAMDDAKRLGGRMNWYDMMAVIYKAMTEAAPNGH